MRALVKLIVYPTTAGKRIVEGRHVLEISSTKEIAVLLPDITANLAKQIARQLRKYDCTWQEASQAEYRAMNFADSHTADFQRGIE